MLKRFFLALALAAGLLTPAYPAGTISCCHCFFPPLLGVTLRRQLEHSGSFLFPEPVLSTAREAFWVDLLENFPMDCAKVSLTPAR